MLFDQWTDPFPRGKKIRVQSRGWGQTYDVGGPLPPEAQLSRKTLLVPGIMTPFNELMALAATAGLESSTKQYPALTLWMERPALATRTACSCHAVAFPFFFFL